MTGEEIEKALWSQIERVNAGLESYEKIRRIVVLENDFPLEVRSINQFQKVKVDRKAVADHFGHTFENIYAEAGGVEP